MELSRRNFLHFTIGAGPALLRFWVPLTAEGQGCTLPLPPQQAQPFTLPTNPSVTKRLSVQELSADPTLVQDLRAAVKAMRELPATDVRQWAKQTALHCAFCGGGPGLEDIHFTWSFLPWHRCFLYFHERMLGQLIGKPMFRVPYWNWESPQSRTVPGIYAAQQSNSLFETRNPAGALTASLVNVNPLLGLGQFADFGGGATSGSSAYGGPHALVHNWANAIFSNPMLSPTDPLFYPHHANIDRLWASWLKLGTGRTNPTNDPNFMKKPLYFFDELKVWRRIEFGQLLDTRALGYEYSTLMQLLGTPPTHLITMGLSGSTARLVAADATRLSSTPTRSRSLVLRGVDVSGLKVQRPVYGIFGNAPAGVALSVSHPSFLGIFANVLDPDHQHPIGRQTVALEVTSKLPALLSTNNNQLRLRVYEMNPDGKVTGDGSDLKAESVYINE